MNISKDNYEAFFLDYHEGNLLPPQVEELMLFLNLHPELAEQFNDYEAISIPLISIPFENKAQLKKGSFITVNNCNEFFIRYIENDLTDGEKQLVHKFLKANPVYNKDFDLYKKTRLVTDASIVFAHKSKLKRSAKRKAPVIFYWSAAASIAIFLSLYFIVRQYNTTATKAVIAVTRPVNTGSVKFTQIKPGKRQTALVTNDKEQVADKGRDIHTDKSKQIINQHNKALRSDKYVNVKPLYLTDETAFNAHVAIPGLKPSHAPVFETLITNEADDQQAQYLSLTEFAEKKISDKYLVSTTRDDDDISLPVNSSKRTGLTALAGRFIESITGTKTVIQTKRNRKGQMVAYQFAAGDFEISRSVSK